jgi:N6-adenosine-specific RNA methylase IME4
MAKDDNVAMWGELREGLHGAGYTFERACKRLETLLEGAGWKVGGRFKTVNEFLNSLSLASLRAPAESRKRIAARIKQLQPKASNRKIANTLGVGNRTIDRDVAPNGALGTKKASKINDPIVATAPNGAPALSSHEAARVVARAERVKDQQRSTSERTATIAFNAQKLGKFSVILADPPWDDEFGASNRSIENHYPTMKFEDILALPVHEIAHEQAMLFLWATPSMLEMALTTAKTWGFEYRTQLIWVKPSIGLGKYVRQRHEILLICRRGDHPAPLAENLQDSVIEAPRSEQPAEKINIETWSCSVPGKERRGWIEREEISNATILLVCFADVSDLAADSWRKVATLDCVWIPFAPLGAWFWDQGEERWELQDNQQDNHSLPRKVPISEIDAAGIGLTKARSPVLPRQSYRKPRRRRHSKIKQIQGQNCLRLCILKPFDKCMVMRHAAVLVTSNRDA